MNGFYTNIEVETLENTSFRKVLFTGKHTQLVVMSLKPKEDIGMETHKQVDQFFRFEEGVGKVIIDASEYNVVAGDAVVVPAGSRHNIINVSQTDNLKLYTLYSPPNHPDGTIHNTKEDADAAEKLGHK